MSGIYSRDLESLIGFYMDNSFKNNVGSNVMDIQNLDSLRKGALSNDKDALKEVAKQFESLFTDMLMKSMRKANAAFETDNPMNNNYTQFYRDMQDKQMSADISQSGSLGLADVIVKQLSNDGGNYMPASTLKGDSDPLSKIGKGDAAPAAVAAALAAKAKALKAEKTDPDETDKVDAASKNNAAGNAENADPQRTSRFSSPAEFISALLPLAGNAGKKLNISPKVLLAQAALETGWGQKMTNAKDGSSSNNLFNIKADKRWEGPTASVDTLEFKDGVAKRENHQFRSYDDFQSSFDDFASFLKSGNRYSGALKNSANSAQFLNGLQDAGYATDPDYASKIQNILKSKIFDGI